jgi:signal transduction histidine kinase
MRGYLRLLEQQGSELTDPHRAAVAASLRAGDRATEVLQQLSVLARLHRGEATPSLSRTALEPLLRSAVHTVVMPADPMVTTHVGDMPDAWLMADEALLRTAIASLTSAVVKAQATDNRVYLLARDEPNNGEQGVTLTITAMEAISGTHEDRPVDLLRGGLGLDLPIASFILDAHRGHVLERRSENRLTGFTIWLPAGA